MTGPRRVNLPVVRGAMASRRGGTGLGPAGLVTGALLVTMVLAASIQVSGQVTNLREEIQTLARRHDELSACHAKLALHWNTESSRQVIMRRAQIELDLESVDEPALLLVATAVTAGDDRAALLALDRAAPSLPTARAGEQP